MKAVLINKPFEIEVVEVEKEKLGGDDFVLIKVESGGLCGSDIHGYHGTSPFIKYPVVPGHEFSGVVVETGKNVNNIEVGDHVSVDPVNSCGECFACKSGRYNVCENLEVLGVHRNGGFKEYVTVHSASCHKIDKNIPFETACLVEPFTIASQSLGRGKIQKDDVVFIAGAGSIGLAILLTAKSHGATVIVSDLESEKLEKAKALGADYTINTKEKSLQSFIEENDNILGITLALDAVGHPSVIEGILPAMLPTGRVVLLGFLKQPSNLIQMEVTKKELDIVGSRLSCNKFPIVVEQIEKKLFDPQKIISHRFKFDEIEKAIKLLEEKPNECGKIVFSF